ncbi:MAG: FtsW/RodA/SpoVE family cell cycle protein, partial [Patescibacteria group bacterium]|nr:FtsW/RodA/SpoVE family cell cycle protein [Patescibacteria group bacterium]
MPTGILARFRKQYNIPGTQSSGMDWLLVLAILPILAASLVTMHSFTGDSSYAAHQFIVIAVSFAAFFVAYRLDARILRSTWFSVSFYSVSLALLLLLSVLGKVSHGAQSWFTIAGLSFQPSDFAKLALLIILAKYFSRRHIEIANIKHIIISGIYAFIFFAIVLTNPDLGSAMMMFLIWLGMVMVSGISKKHLLAMIAVVAIVFALLWNFG